MSSWWVHENYSRIGGCGEGFVGTSRALYEDFARCKGTMEALQGGCKAFTEASPIATRALWSRFEGFARRSCGISFGNICQIITGRQQFKTGSK